MDKTLFLLSSCIITYGSVSAMENYRGYLDPLHKAAQDGDMEAVRILLDNGADVNKQDDNGHGYIPLHWAVFEGHLEIVRLFLDRGADINSHDNNVDTVMYFALNFGKLEFVRDHKYSFTPLHIAVQTVNLEIVRLLLDRSADVNVQDDNGDTPLHWAVSKAI